jgi:hypothetical protein
MYRAKLISTNNSEAIVEASRVPMMRAYEKYKLCKHVVKLF